MLTYKPVIQMLFKGLEFLRMGGLHACVRGSEVWNACGSAHTWYCSDPISISTTHLG